MNNLSYEGLKYNEEAIHTNHTQDEYESEYLSAYGYLERAEWRLSEVDVMSDFYSEPDFFYFGMNNLSSARHRIQHYLENTNWTIFDDLEYQEYDSLVMDYYQPIRLGKPGWEKYYNESHDKWHYYWNLYGTAQLKKYVLEDCIEIRDRLNKFIDYINDEDYTVLTRHSEELECLSNNTLNFLLDIPIVPFKG